MDTIKTILVNHRVKKGDAVMFDIDDTLIRADSGKPMYAIIELLNLSIFLGYTVVIITARPDYVENVTHTEQQLVDLGINYNLLLFCPPQEKTNKKKETGLNYILSVGDQLTDLEGGLYFLKLPDYTDTRYYIGSSTSSD